MKLLNRLIGKVMGTFVAQGVSIDDEGRLCLPDGLTPDRVHRFIELCVDAEFACPRDAMHHLFARVGVGEKAEDLQPFSAQAYARALVGLADMPVEEPEPA